MMGLIGARIKRSFELESEGFRRRWENDPIGFLTEHCGRKYPPKIRKFFEDLYFDRVWHAALKAGRGGGKTVTFADLATCKYLFKKWDSLFAGGSEAQAKKGYNYAASNLDLDEIEDFNAETLKTLVESQYGNSIKFVAASSKQVRGPHLGAPNKKMGNDMQPYGGLLIIDEECEADDDIVTAVKKTVNTARPGQIVRGSTLHKITGSFAELCEDPGKYGATLYEWDCFDTAERCERKCSECRFEFAGNKRRGFLKWRKQHPEWKHDRGYCEGKGKHGEGWRRIWGSDIGTVESSFVSATCLEEFEVEEMGWRAAGSGLVLDPVLLDRSLRGRAEYMEGMPTMLEIDWGYSGWTCIHVLQQQADHMIVVLRTVYYHLASATVIYQDCELFRDLYNAWTVCADESHKFENDELKNRGFDVVEVGFNKWKEYGAGWIKGLLERGRLWIQGEILGDEKNWTDRTDRTNMRKGKWFVDAHAERFFRELKGWRRGKDGKIVKKDDHGPDSFLCAAVRWGEGINWNVKSIASSGRREIMDVAGIR